MNVQNMSNEQKNKQTCSTTSSSSNWHVSFCLPDDSLPSLLVFFGPSGYWWNDHNLSFGCRVIPKNELFTFSIPWFFETFYSVIYFFNFLFRHFHLKILEIVLLFLLPMMFLRLDLGIGPKNWKEYVGFCSICFCSFCSFLELFLRRSFSNNLQFPIEYRY